MCACVENSFIFSSLSVYNVFDSTYASWCLTSVIWIIHIPYIIRTRTIVYKHIYRHHHQFIHCFPYNFTQVSTIFPGFSQQIAQNKNRLFSYWIIMEISRTKAHSDCRKKYGNAFFLYCLLTCYHPVTILHIIHLRYSQRKYTTVFLFVARKRNLFENACGEVYD